MHPEEGALLCTVPPNYVFPMSPRSALCLLGQVAAPLQVLWIQAQTHQQVQVGMYGTSSVDAMQCVHRFQQGLMSMVRQRWITKKMYIPRSLHFETAEGGLSVNVSEPVTAGQLIGAEKQLQGWGHIPVLTLGDFRLPAQSMLHEDEMYGLHFKVPRQLKPCPFPSLTEEVVGMGAPEDEFQSRGLGDRIIWQCLQKFMEHDVSIMEGQPKRFFTLYPFRAAQMMKHGVHYNVAQTWREQYRCTQGNILLIAEHCNHWVVLHAHKETLPMGTALRWTLYDGLPSGTFASEIAEVATGTAQFMTDILG